MTEKHSPLITRPGGFEITDEAVRHCRFKPGALLADIGCGYGDTAKYLFRRYGFDVTGVDVNGELISQESCSNQCRFICADAAELPFADCSLDGIFYECSFSKMDEPERALAEAFRSLKSGGRIAISDFYAAGAETACGGLLGRIESRRRIELRLAEAGFEPEYFKDFSGKMNELFGQLIFDYGREKLYEMLGGESCAIDAAKPGYGLFVAVKR